MPTRALAIALCAALACGCAGQSPLFGEPREALIDFVLPPQQAAALGQRLAEQVQRERGLHPSVALARRVERVGQRVVAGAGDLPDTYQFSFKVLDEPHRVNAFGLPNGTVFVSSGLVQMAGSDAELASVLAHEVAHVTQRHAVGRLAAAYGAERLAAMARGDEPGTLAQVATNLLEPAALLEYARPHELEAHRVGLTYFARAGYDPQAALAMLRKLEPGEGVPAPALRATHPALRERIERVEQALGHGGEPSVAQRTR